MTGAASVLRMTFSKCSSVDGQGKVICLQGVTLMHHHYSNMGQAMQLAVASALCCHADHGCVREAGLLPCDWTQTRGCACGVPIVVRGSCS